MLRTTAITQFFNANLTSPHLDTLLLTTPSGKLLSLSSPLPVSILRTQATLASQLWSSYQPVIENNLVSASLPTTSSAATSDDQELKCITVQLEQGIMVIRQLHCSLLFIAIGSTPNQRPQTSTASIISTDVSGTASSRTVTPTPYHPPLTNPQSPPPPNFSRELEQANGIGGGGADHVGGGSVHTIDTRSSTGIGTSMTTIQRHTEELGKWLDAELAGFELTPTS